MGNFVWKMTEDDWKKMRSVDAAQDDSESMDVFGMCLIGKIDFEFHHTLDKSCWCLYVDAYVIDEDNGYSNLLDGTRYDYYDWNGGNSFFGAETFDEFKRLFEMEVRELYAVDRRMRPWIDADDLWTKHYEVERYEI